MNTIELFAGAGGMALGFERAGFKHILLNEFDKNACQTLKTNRPKWSIIQQDISTINWKEYTLPEIDIITGGFPCQSFSYSGKRLGLEDTRGTLFYEFARAVDEIQPLCFLAENVKGLLNHNSGKTINTILSCFKDIGYHIFTPTIFNANDFHVAQKRERLFIYGVRKDIAHHFTPLSPTKSKPISLQDIFLFDHIYPLDINDLPQEGYLYSEKKANLFNLIKPGRNWRDLPLSMQKDYLGKMFNSGGGKTGILKRLDYQLPSVTILTSPSQKQTERCHPTENRPLTIRESARIQSFPDDWLFSGSISSQYKQIGNAVPVNLAYALAKDISLQIIKYRNSKT